LSWVPVVTNLDLDFARHVCVIARRRGESTDVEKNSFWKSQAIKVGRFSRQIFQTIDDSIAFKETFL
jgi:hypothetical protein